MNPTRTLRLACDCDSSVLHLRLASLHAWIRAPPRYYVANALLSGIFDLCNFYK